MRAQGSPEGTVQVQLTLLAQEALGQPELAATSDARLQAAFGQAVLRCLGLGARMEGQ